MLDDSSARRRAVDPSRSCIVQAPAGSGKTSLLVERFVVLLSQADTPEEVVAITHTRKAAGEMRERISAVIRSDSSSLPRHQQALAARLAPLCARLQAGKEELIARLRVITIDGLCQGLAQQSSYHQLNFANASVSDHPQALYRRAVQQALAGLWGDTPDPQMLLVWRHYGCNTAQLESELVRMLGKREQWLPHFAGLAQEAEQKSGLLQMCAASWQKLGAMQLQTLQTLAGENFIQHWQAMASRALFWIEASDQPETKRLKKPLLTRIEQPPGDDPYGWWKAVHALVCNGQGEVYKRASSLGFPADSSVRGADKKALKIDKQLCDSSLDELRDNAPLVYQLALLVRGDLPAGQSELLGAIARVAVRAVAELQLVFAAAQQLDFVQVAFNALDALEKQPDSTAIANHLLVDEFQDTSPLQWRLIEALVQGWDAKNSLFLVGDPMQSIYRFRQARVQLFMRAWQQGIAGVRLKNLQLTSNFRSQPALVDWVNTVGERLFAGNKGSLHVVQVPFAAATPASGLAAADTPELRHSPGIEREQEVLRLLAEQTAGSSVALLLQKRLLAAPLIEALKQQGIGFSAVELIHMANRQHIVDVLNLARLCVEPDNWRHWLGVLRAPQIGAPLSLCTRLYGYGLAPLEAIRRYLQTEQPPRNGDDMRERCSWLLARVEPVLGLCGLRPLAQLAQILWSTLGFEILLAEQQRQECRELLRMVAESSRAHGGWWCNWQEIDLWLGTRHSSVVYDHSSTSFPVLDIQIMTCHKAKGLEFDLVVLPYADSPDRYPRHETPPFAYDEVLIDGAPRLLMATGSDAFGEEKNESFAFLQQLEKDEEEAERQRLLYVALTRAKGKLVVMGEEQAVQGKERSFFSRLLESGCRLHTSEQGDTNAQPTGSVPTTAASDALALLTRITDFTALAARLPDAQPEVEFITAREHFQPELSALLGSALHQIVENLHHLAAAKDFDLKDCINVRRDSWLASLNWLGIPQSQREITHGRLFRTLDALARDDRFAWLLAPHDNKHCEWQLVAMQKHAQGRDVQLRVLDLSFCADGYCWVIDYKAMQRKDNESDAGLMQRAKLAYMEQLEAYAGLVKKLLASQLPIRLGVYLLLQQLWIEWDYTGPL